MIDFRVLIEQDCEISVREQCELLEISRSSFYYNAKGENPENLEAMRLMDHHIMQEPTAGVITMKLMLKEKEINMSYERVRRLMRKASIMPIYPRRMLTQKGENKYIYPYLLRNLEISKPNQVWQIDITYIPMKNGFMYMTAVIDVYSRYIVGWGISNSLDASESLKVVKEAMKIHGKPDILNSDQGTQFSCKSYVEYLKKEEIKISMDGKGRCLDNIFIERFWRTIKYQHIFLNPAKDGLDLYLGIQKWLQRYHNRGHQGIELKKPAEKYILAA
jgi:putative transposase